MNTKRRFAKPGRLVTALLILCTVTTALVSGWWLPTRAVERRVRNDHAAQNTLRLLYHAERAFRERQPGGWGRCWTGDVAGLYQQGGLIDRSVAEADARPLNPLVRKPVPRFGYYFVAMEVDESRAPPEQYRQASDDRGAKVYHPQKFAFCAYPAECSDPIHSYVYIMNQDATMLCTVAIEAKPVLTWPGEEEKIQGDWHWPGDY